MKRYQPTILAHDPSICAWGWAVLYADGTVLETGCIKTESSNKKLNIRKGDDRIRRVNEINQELLRIIDKYKIRWMVSEQPHGSQSAVAAVMIGICLGMLQTISDCKSIGLEWYSEGDCKKTLLGKRSAVKGETIAAVHNIFDVKWTGIKYIDEAVADAISVFYCAKKTSSVLKNGLFN